MSLRNILVIGGTRFIGARVVRQLAEQGHSLTVYHRGEHESSLPETVRHVRRPQAAMPIRSFPAELLTPTPDVVIHMIAMGEADTRAALDFFRGRTGRVAWISSGDVYRAYGRFIGTESGALETMPLREGSPLRSVWYPYRDPSKLRDDFVNIYEKILVERSAMSDPGVPATILRLPKVYGPEENADLATVYGFRNYPQWRWTHGYVENVAAAIALAALHPAAQNRIFNVGEEYTPTMSERLAKLPDTSVPVNHQAKFNFEQDIVYDTNSIRQELGYRDVVSEEDAMIALCRGTSPRRS